MYRKLVGLSLLIFLLTLLTGCTPVPPEKIEQPGLPSPEATTTTLPAGQTPGPLTPIPAILTGCTNVKSNSFNIGAAVGSQICLEGTIEKIIMPGQDSRFEIVFDTATGKNSGSLYNITVFIPDGNTFGLDYINQLTTGMYIAVKGQFSQGWSQKSFTYTYYIEVNQSDDLAVLG